MQLFTEDLGFGLVLGLEVRHCQDAPDFSLCEGLHLVR